MTAPDGGSGIRTELYPQVDLFRPVRIGGRHKRHLDDKAAVSRRCREVFHPAASYAVA